ncbi:MAG: hypothetical protein ABIE55_04445 [Candidatus Aenigmatarchaeota archaeon]
MKGQVWAYAFVGITLILTSLFLLRLNMGYNVERNIVTVEGKLLSFSNQAELLLKSFDQSLYFISQRAAFELGKTGGLEYEDFWTPDYPKIQTLEDELVRRIKRNMPKSYEKGSISVNFDEAEIDVNDHASTQFFVRGSRYISFYDEGIDARISVDHKIDSIIDSNYFKLLNAGRAIMEDSHFEDILSNPGALVNELYNLKGSGDPRFVGLDFNRIANIDENIVEITIVGYCPHSDAYCLAPLKPGEPSSINALIPYEYVELRFKYKKEITGDDELEFDFGLTVDPGSVTFKVVCP